MKKFLKNAFLFSVVVMGLGIGSQSYAAEEQAIDSTSTSSTQQILESSPVVSDSSTALESTSVGQETVSSTTNSQEDSSVASIQESPTTLWDIEDENNVKYDKDQKDEQIEDDMQIDTRKVYDAGIKANKIDEEKYPFELFKAHEKEYFIPLYKVFISFEENKDISYESWIAINEYGVDPETKNPFFEEKPDRVKRDWKDNQKKFINTVKKGDILVVKDGGSGGLIGHAAIMTSDNLVLELVGWGGNQDDNSNQQHKSKWFEKNRAKWTTVYRVNNSSARNGAANWCDRTFWNSNGGYTKNRKIGYSLWPWHNFDVKNPNYCSKMVLQGYYFGTGSLPVVTHKPVNGEMIPPLGLPTYFTNDYKLNNKGEF